MTLYSDKHLWAVECGDGKWKLGITGYAAIELDGIVYVDPGKSQRVVKSGDALGSVESNKTVADIVCPFDCEIEAVNDNLNDDINAFDHNPEDEEKHWIYIVKPTNGVTGLMDRREYLAFLGNVEEGL